MMLDVVDAGGGGQVEHRFDDPLADVGPAHLRQRQRHVVEGDGELHARRCSSAGSGSQSPSGLAQRVLDGAVDVVEAVERLAGVDDPAAAGRQLLQAEALAVVEQDRRRRRVDLEHESGAGHQRLHRLRSFSARRSKAILTAPRRAGVGGVLDGLAVAGEGVGGRHQAAEVGVGAPSSKASVEVVASVARRRRRRRRPAAPRGATAPVRSTVTWPGHADQHHVARRGATIGQRLGDGCRPSRRSRAPRRRRRQLSRPASWRRGRAGPVTRRTARRELARRRRPWSAPELRASRRCSGCLADVTSSVGRRGGGRAAMVQQAEGAGADARPPTPLDAAAGQGGVDGAGGRLDHHRGLVADMSSGTGGAGSGGPPCAVDQPPPVSPQYPVCRPGSSWPKRDALAAA